MMQISKHPLHLSVGNSFLLLLPILYICQLVSGIVYQQERIYEIHRAVARGRLRDVQALLDRKKLALARDPLGATPLHKAVMYGHRDIVEYIAMNFPLSKDTKDLKGKTAEYYLQFSEHLHLEQLLKQSQRANANYMANHANRIKAVASPKRKSPYPTRAALALDFNGNIRPTNGEVQSDSAEDSEPVKNGHVSFKMPKKTLFRSQPLLPPPKLKRKQTSRCGGIIQSRGGLHLLINFKMFTFCSRKRSSLEATHFYEKGRRSLLDFIGPDEPMDNSSDIETNNETPIKTFTFSNALHCFQAVESYLMQSDENDTIFSFLHTVEKELFQVRTGDQLGQHQAVGARGRLGEAGRRCSGGLRGESRFAEKRQRQAAEIHQ
ncbi:UNVERIFIED_CONTAM: hypothetical protein NCL1_45648 [Trichonephila clavipes]